MRRMAFSCRSFVENGSLLWIAAITLLPLLAACANSHEASLTPTGPSPMTSAGSAPAASPTVIPTSTDTARVPRHVAGLLDGRFDFTRTWGPEWWQFYSDADTSGTLSHLGLSRMHTTHIPNIATGALEQGTFRIVAANGDEIAGTYQGTASYDEVRADLAHGVATLAVTGGTGRFLGATGTINATFLETFDDPTWASAKVAWTLSGTVRY